MDDSLAGDIFLEINGQRARVGEKCFKSNIVKSVQNGYELFLANPTFDLISQHYAQQHYAHFNITNNFKHYK